MARVRYVDSQVFIYWLGGHPRFGEAARNWVKMMEAGKGFITSTFAVYEVVTALAGLRGSGYRDPRFTADVVEAIGKLGGLRIVSTTVDDVLYAPLYVEKFRITFSDAIHYCIAKRVGANEIISPDTDFDKTDLKRVF